MGYIVNIMLVKKFFVDYPGCIRNDFIHPPAQVKLTVYGLDYTTLWYENFIDTHTHTHRYICMCVYMY